MWFGLIRGSNGQCVEGVGLSPQPLGSTREERVRRRVPRSRGFELVRCLWEPGSRSQELRGEDKWTEERAGGWTGRRIRGCDMKLLPSWTAVLRGKPWGRAWPWAQRPTSRWTLMGLGQHRREQSQGPQAQAPPAEDPQPLGSPQPPGGEDRPGPGRLQWLRGSHAGTSA